MISKKEARIGSRGVFQLTGKTGEGYRGDSGGVFVFVQNSRQGDKGYWPWSHVLMRTPHRIKRFPRLLRYPRLQPTNLCHCKGGRLSVRLRYEDVICKRCQKAIGTESFPKRIEQASRL